MRIRDFTFCALFSGIIAACSLTFFPLPFTQVPITLQTLPILISGAVLGPKRAIISVCLYILLGVTGLPVFSGMQSGPGVLLGSTGGYLIGFIPGAYISGLLTRKFYTPSHRHSFLRFAGIFVSMSLALVVIYVFGILQYAYIHHLNMKQALITCVLPFVWADLFKIIIASFLSDKLLSRQYLNQNLTLY